MTRLHCISNRNLIIIAAYVAQRLGSHQGLFNDLPYPTEQYASAEKFFLNEDEWTTYENYHRVFRRARAMVDEPDFYFRCGASAARLRSWGRFHHFAALFGSPDDGFRELPFFNKNLDDTKEVSILLPPTYDRRLRKMRVILKVIFHPDFDPHDDYVGDPYFRGLVGAIPTVWGLPPALIKQPLNPYDPVRLLAQEPEFAPFDLEPQMEEDRLSLRDPQSGRRVAVGERVRLVRESLSGRKVFLGRYEPRGAGTAADDQSAVAITRTLQVGDRVIVSAGEIFLAPYFVLDIAYDRMPAPRRVLSAAGSALSKEIPEKTLIDTIDRLRAGMAAKSKAYDALERAHAELARAKEEVERYAAELESRVQDRTVELQRAQAKLVAVNRELEGTVSRQVAELERYRELRRYLSPRITEAILAGSQDLGPACRRRLLSVVFTDIRGFSSITDGLEPEEMLHLLNGYLAEMVAVVHCHDGTLNKIMGDGLCIFFGDPVPAEDHAARAVGMAVEMQQRVMGLKPAWERLGHPLDIGIGINTGYVTVGHMGPEAHRDYTVIGTHVNVASRLAAAAGPGEILISRRTHSRVEGLFPVTERGPMSLKGIHRPVITYSVLWDLGSVPGAAC